MDPYILTHLKISIECIEDMIWNYLNTGLCIIAFSIPPNIKIRSDIVLIFKISFSYHILHVENSLESKTESKAKASISTKLYLLIKDCILILLDLLF